MTEHDLTLSFINLSPQDADLLSKLHPQIFKHQVWTEDDFRTLLTLSTIEGILMLKDEKPIGYIIWQNTPDESEIITFGIIPSFQKRGYGQILYSQFEEMKFLQQTTKILLEVSATNQRALHFYEKNGFATMSIRKNYYNESGQQVDAILMMKRL